MMILIIVFLIVIQVASFSADTQSSSGIYASPYAFDSENTLNKGKSPNNREKIIPNNGLFNLQDVSTMFSAFSINKTTRNSPRMFEIGAVQIPLRSRMYSCTEERLILSYFAAGLEIRESDSSLKSMHFSEALKKVDYTVSIVIPNFKFTNFFLAHEDINNFDAFINNNPGWYNESIKNSIRTKLENIDISLSKDNGSCINSPKLQWSFPEMRFSDFLKLHLFFELNTKNLNSEEKNLQTNVDSCWNLEKLSKGFDLFLRSRFICIGEIIQGGLEIYSKN
ncbi:hypothetical protein HMI54_004873 [Coelomomyces lativittatus]|nr:hypothetical protein HMI55_002222 [Coelomomyces lativittatus]KAJ1506682.1 hypothetical protein HMI54_004873 [Coelomomyces lativittatus]KAJ1510768.1 hypothetical protein HMI56_006181 [Coelomomyces lativittatus]